jgi:hypothetical protein
VTARRTPQARPARPDVYHEVHRDVVAHHFLLAEEAFMFTALPRRSRPSRRFHGRPIVELLEDRLVLQAGEVIGPGFDLWTTPPPDGTLDSFMNVQLPADFFAPGSLPFDGPVFLQGLPTGPLGRPAGPIYSDVDTVVMRSATGLLEFNRLPGDFAPLGAGPGLGMTDTIVRRAEMAPLLDGPPETVPIELVALSLVSCSPITVSGSDGSTTQWDVRVDVSPAVPQPQGNMTVTKTHANGGTFQSTLPVRPRLTFTKIDPSGGPPTQRVLDTENPEIFIGSGPFVVIEEHDDYARSLGQVALVMPDGSTDTIALRGTSAVRANVVPRGDAVDTDGDGLDQVQTELVSLDLRGTGTVGPVQVRMHPQQRVFGVTEERVNATPNMLDTGPFAAGLALSAFDVFFEVQFGGQVFYTDKPVHLEGSFTRKPVGTDEPFR